MNRASWNDIIRVMSETLNGFLNAELLAVCLGVFPAFMHACFSVSVVDELLLLSATSKCSSFMHACVYLDCEHLNCFFYQLLTVFL